jgi:hypothetical protein
MKEKLEKMKRLFSLYKIKYESKIVNDRYIFNCQTQDGLKFETIDEVNYHLSINARSYDLTLQQYLDVWAFQIAYKSFVENKAQILLDKYLLTLNKIDRKLINKIIKK